MRIRPQQRGSAFRASRLCSYLTEDENRPDCRRAAQGRDRAAAGTGATHLSQRRHRTTRGDVQPIPSRRSVRRRGIKAIKRFECKTLRINADSRPTSQLLSELLRKLVAILVADPTPTAISAADHRLAIRGGYRCIDACFDACDPWLPPPWQRCGW